MCEAGYLEEAEVPRIPRFDRRATGIVYGPLADLPVEPDAILFWARPVQAMVVREATGGAAWTTDPTGDFFGRPACAVLPAAVARDGVAFSLGCIGMRMFTGIGDDRILIAVSGAALDRFRAGIDKAVGANRTMESLYRSRLDAC